MARPKRRKDEKIHNLVDKISGANSSSSRKRSAAPKEPTPASSPEVSLLQLVPRQISAAASLSNLLDEYFRGLEPIGYSRGILGPIIGTALGSRPNNQDRAAVATFSSGATLVQIGVLADGVGGMQHGEKCASAVVASFAAAAYVIILSGENDATRVCDQASRYANGVAYHTFRGKSGSTLAAYVRLNDSLSFVYAGDSKIFGITEAGDLDALTVDDTMAARFATLPGLDPMLRNSRGLLQYVGMGDDFSSHVHSLDMQRYSAMILASDGITAIPPELIQQLHAGSEPAAFVRRLTSLAAILPNADNCTLILTELSQPPRVHFNGFAVEDVNGCIVLPQREVLLSESTSSYTEEKAQKTAGRNSRPPTEAKRERPRLEISD